MLAGKFFDPKYTSFTTEEEWEDMRAYVKGWFSRLDIIIHNPYTNEEKRNAIFLKGLEDSIKSVTYTIDMEN